MNWSQLSELNLSFGALAPQIIDQLSAQGLTLVKDDARLQQKIADAVTLLSIHGVLTVSRTAEARRRIVLRSD